MRSNRKGQIFLIVTVLIITFMIGITGILVDVQRAQYLEPAPDTDIVLEAWKNTYEAIESILQIELAIRSNGPSVNQADIDLSTQFNNLESYMQGRGVSTVIDITNIPDYTITGDATSSTTVSITGGFDVYMQSGNVEITQSFDLTITYNATVDANFLYLSKTINTETAFIAGATLSSVSDPTAIFNDYQNGQYAHTLVSTDDLGVNAPGNIDLQLILP